ncbi:hypothetical protein CBL_11270 [Carabus blaptoides fortunei]
MTRFVLYLIFVLCIVATWGNPLPGSSKHVRIHVPRKIHTVFVTKFVKVPEHHHHHHVIKKEQHHHHHNHKSSDESIFEDNDTYGHDSI